MKHYLLCISITGERIEQDKGMEEEEEKDKERSTCTFLYITPTLQHDKKTISNIGEE